MSNVQIMSIESARKQMARARKELELAKINDTVYRGTRYSIEHEPAETHGTFVYRGRTYTK
tara:strand:+ start:284 stop:466 length:183 start_codon:yes stop_codon:yes gene_type:complete